MRHVEARRARGGQAEPGKTKSLDSSSFIILDIGVPWCPLSAHLGANCPFLLLLLVHPPPGSSSWLILLAPPPSSWLQPPGSSSWLLLLAAPSGSSSWLLLLAPPGCAMLENSRWPCDILSIFFHLHGIQEQ